MTELTQARLKDLLHYNPDTGIFIWIASLKNGVRIGSVAGTLDSGYIRIKIQGRLYLAHRLAWLYTYREWPKDQIDHINMFKNDNRISNLREATRSENFANRRTYANSVSGLKGASWKKSRGKWQADITINGKSKYLGLFTTKQEAHAAYCKAADEHHKEFANYG